MALQSITDQKTLPSEAGWATAFTPALGTRVLALGTASGHTWDMRASVKELALGSR